MNNHRMAFKTSQLNRTYRLTELAPYDPTYKKWATRDTLTKYYEMGKRAYTKWDAE